VSYNSNNNNNNNDNNFSNYHKINVIMKMLFKQNILLFSIKSVGGGGGMC